MSPKSSCKGCTERHPGCHAQCEDYKAFKEKRDFINTKRREEQKSNDDYYTARRFHK